MDEPGAGTSLRAWLLGPVRLMVGEMTITERAWPRRAARSLLWLLLITPGHRLPRERVLDTLWPDASPESADQSLRKAIHALRRVLEPKLQSGRASAWLEVGSDSVALLDTQGLWIDAEAFEQGLLAARSGTEEQRRTRLRQTLNLYGGELIADEPYLEWIGAPRERLKRLHRRAVLDSAELDLRAGDLQSSIPPLEHLLEVDGTDEVALRALMRALGASGRRDDAMRWYQRVSESLLDDLEQTPEGETRLLVEEIQSLTPSSAASLPVAISMRPQANIPAPPNRLIGRVRELERLQDLLLDSDIRMVTVTGPGGVGKSRLTLEAGRRVADDFEEGACFVGLAPIRDTAQVMPAIARALGLAESGLHSAEEVIVAALQDRDVLLVLDNFEQVIDAAPQIAALLEGADRLKVLVTSREPLRIRAEHEVALAPLSVPRSAVDGISRALVRYEAVELFLHRAHAVWPSFVLTDDNAFIVAAICQRLDGLPLAIELAAAQVRSTSLEELLAGLNDRFALLAGGYRDLPSRHHSLRDAIGWSYDLLSRSRRKLFRRLAVFAGGFTTDAAEHVLITLGHDDSDATGRQHQNAASIHVEIEALVASSLVQQDEGEAGTRYSMLESIREYGLSELLASDGEAVRSAHATWMLALAEESAASMKEPDQVVWLDRLEAELDNIRAALEWSLGQAHSDTAIRLASELRRLWFVRGYLTEGRDWIERALRMSQTVDPATRAKALFAAGELSFFLEDQLHARACAEEGLEICRALGDSRGMADALLGLGHIARQSGDMDGAETYLQEGISLARTAGDDWHLPLLLEALGALRLDRGELDGAEEMFKDALNRYRHARHDRGAAAILASLAKAARQRGDTGSAIALLEQSVSIVRQLRDVYAIAADLYALGNLLATVGDHARAEAALHESLTIAHEYRMDAHAAGVLKALASVAVSMGRPERAARLFGAVEAFCESVGVAYPDLGEIESAVGEVSARDALGEASFNSARTLGRALTADQAVAEALTSALPEKLAPSKRRPSRVRGL